MSRRRVLPDNKPVPLPDRKAYTVEEFCIAHHISRPFFYKLLKDGTGPRVMKLGSRTLISIESAADWRRASEVPAQTAA
jgi:predicted DNA-binding transcriptional regulator AlpA